MTRLTSLDGLRGVLAFYVMLGHLAPFALLPSWLQSAVSHGGAAVDVFFILSGLVISRSLQRAGGQAVPFLMGRAARIFPVFLPVFAFAVLMAPMSCGFERMPWIGMDNPARTICVSAWPASWPVDLTAHLTMIHGLFPNGLLPNIWVSFLGSAWSLSTEWQFYIAALLLYRTGAARFGSLLLGLAAAGVVWKHATPETWQFSRAFLANKAHFFALGIASLPLMQRREGGLLAFAVALAATLAVCADDGGFSKLLPPLAWTFCLAVQMRPDKPLLQLGTAVLRSQMAQYLGVVSYSLYLVNEPIHKMLAGTISRIAGGDAAVFTALWLPAAILLPVIAAGWLQTRIEVPMLRWGHAVAGRYMRPKLGRPT